MVWYMYVLCVRHDAPGSRHSECDTRNILRIRTAYSYGRRRSMNTFSGVSYVVRINVSLCMLIPF
jgi:hypothetical protein